MILYTKAVTAAAGVWCQDCVDSIRRLYQSCYIKAHCNIPLILSSALLLLFQTKLNAVFYMWRDFCFGTRRRSAYEISRTAETCHLLYPQTPKWRAQSRVRGDMSSGEHPSNHHSCFFFFVRFIFFSLFFFWSSARWIAGIVAPRYHLERLNLRWLEYSFSH